MADMNFGVHVLPKTTTTYNLGSTDKKWNNIYGTLKGNADSATYATNVRITETNPSSATTYYPNFTTGVAANTNYALRGTKHYYLYDAGTAATGVYLNIGAANYKGGLTLHTNSSYYGDIAPTTLTANRTYTLPDASGTVALTSNLSSYLPLAGGQMTGPIGFGATGMNRAILQYNASYPNYGIWYNDSETDTMRFSASGNANTDAGADLCINGNGAGTVTIRGATILTTGNYSTTCDGRYVKKAGDTMTGHLTAPSTSCSWLSGQNAANAAFNIGDATNTGSYWPWMRQTNTSSSKWFSFGTLNTSFYWMGSATSRTENGYDYGMQFNIANGYLQGCSRVYGAVWNDYAEYRKDNPNENQEPGRCIKELGDGSLALTTKRLERGCEIISDTFGFAIGQDEKNGYNTPIASNGRVLAYPYESIEEFANHIGWPVCSGPNGTVSIMTEEEEEKYPSRIIGTISEIPTYEKWGTGNVKVNGRIWIRIR